MKTLPQPWTVAMEATIFTGWIYDHLLPHAQRVKVAHPLIRAPSQPPRRRTIRLMPARSPTACAVTSCRSAIDPDSRSTPNPALPAPAGAPDGADEESDLGFVDGNWSELQQAAATQSGLFPCDDQRRANATDWPIIWSRDYITHCRIRWLIL